VDTYASGERDLGPPAERLAVGGQRCEKLGDQDALARSVGPAVDLYLQLWQEKEVWTPRR
jgi:hypothetical protein